MKNEPPPVGVVEKDRILHRNFLSEVRKQFKAQLFELAKNFEITKLLKTSQNFLGPREKLLGRAGLVL
jgi:hypothetical protein